MSRRPKSCAHATPDDIVGRILKARFEHPTWGDRKIKARLEQSDATVEWPSSSTIGVVLRRAGLVHPPKRRRKVTPTTRAFATVTAPNQVWCIDFKGFVRCGNGERCDPLTITDAYSRFIIRCQAVPAMSRAHVDAICDAAMREFGMPERIRTDNGAPFATPGALGLSKLSAKWIRLGITHERIEPGCPQQNGQHERMHRTLKEDSYPAGILRTGTATAVR